MKRAKRYFGSGLAGMDPDEVADATDDERYYSQAIEDDYGDSYADDEFEYLREERYCYD